MCPGIDNSGDPAAASVDTDGDGVYDGCDNCKLTSNPEQCDIDGDGEGDACDLDACIVYDNNPDLQCCDEVALISDEGDVIPRQDRPIIPNNSKIGIQNIYPNPFSNQLNIDIRSDIDQEIELFILDVLGNPILLTKEKVTKGRNLISIDMDKNNATGVYTVKIRDKDGNEDNQLVVRIRR